MPSCSLSAPALPSIFHSAKPTFAFSDTNQNHLGFEVSYLNNNNICSYSSDDFVPVLSYGGQTLTCSFSAGPAKSFVLCPTVPVTGLATGTYTLGYTSAALLVIPPLTSTFYIGPDPTTSTQYVVVTMTSTTQDSTPYQTTLTQYKYSSTVTSPTVVEGTGSPVVQTSTAFVNSCPPNSPSASSSSGASSSFTCPDGQGGTINTEKGAFIIECNCDRVGSDMGPVSAANLNQCTQICASTNGCVGVSYPSNGPCYLKYDQPPCQYNSNIRGARLAQYQKPSSTPSTPSSPSNTGLQCPKDDGSSYIATDGTLWVVDCFKDRQDSDLSNTLAYTLNQCIEFCEQFSRCVAVSFVAGSPGTCYIKSAANAYSTNYAVWAARKASINPAPQPAKLHRNRVVRDKRATLEPTVTVGVGAAVSLSSSAAAGVGVSIGLGSSAAPPSSAIASIGASIGSTATSSPSLVPPPQNYGAPDYVYTGNDYMVTATQKITTIAVV
ncbi:hypothetical protein EJ04DRAFT_584844 [Polyplosphaeria fusca]|uniref:Apple domain-containing protein n=1 Tax=Polyplosphaeria fusca TaxID=682080 RepID=A0A9P4UZC0_9PLEO|nr:hypothetical protein EJ04DRAFT_584844 [Polyplosphaeria fusca]